MRDGKAHFPRAAVADEPYRIDSLARWTGSDQHAPPLQGTTPTEQHDAGATGKLEGLEHAARPDLTARLITLRGS